MRIRCRIALTKNIYFYDRNLGASVVNKAIFCIDPQKNPTNSRYTETSIFNKVKQSKRQNFNLPKTDLWINRC